MSARTISEFCAEQLADSVQNSADEIHSCTDLLRLFVFTEIARIYPLEYLILHAHSTGEGHLIRVFRCNLTCFRAFQPVESLKLAMEKIVVKWIEGRSKGALFLQR